ncbi:MAG TPA: GlxA family transcriptional regulator, partial [Solirubrobacteraceae bacterium]|nr:GlxA family transcriptional regulator [Solirubrobacteraceae bacterium]
MRIVIVAFDDVQALDVTGPSEVFSSAARLGHAPYEVTLASPGGRPVRTSSGFQFVPNDSLDAVVEEPDTLIVAGGMGVAKALQDEALIEQLRHARPRRLASVCNGAFLLAAAGRLDGRRATTHWAACAELQRRHPSVDVDPKPIFVRDGDVATSAGVTAGIDLALALVEEDAGAGAALDVARWLVLFLQRPGGQAQFSAQLDRPPAERAPLRELQAWLPDHLDRDLSVEALAERACMSPRNFARAFRRELGVTPARYVADLRLERARQELERDALPVEEIARRCGFGTVETMRRAFQRRFNVNPAAYRSRFLAKQPARPAAH